LLPITMTSSQEHACPRCFGALMLNQAGGHRSQAIVLTCPEAYCDYVLVLGEREFVSASGGWGLSALAWFRRAAS
jgi:hypothetical protein